MPDLLDEDVLRLQIAMGDAFVVSLRERVGDRRDDVQGSLDADRSVGQVAGQRTAGQQLGDQKRHALFGVSEVDQL